MESVCKQLKKKLEKNKELILINDIEGALVAENHVNRCETLKPILNHEQIAALKELKINSNIVIREADRYNNFVIFDKEDYKLKLKVILNDSDKFIRVTKDPTKILK